jgi:RNA polymerase sigma factor (sigma-70 family)
MTKLPAKIDPVLEPLLQETSAEQTDQLLQQLISEHAEPVIKGVIRYKLRLSSNPSSQRSETEDLYQEVILQLLGQLQQFRKLPEAHPINDLRGMSAIIAHRTCSRWMRRQFPERHALKNRLHYLLTRQRGLALWQDDKGKQIAGFAVWQEQTRSVKSLQAGELANAGQLQSQIRLLKSGKQQELGEAVATILNYAGGPIEFDELVSTLATLLGVRDQPLESLAQGEDAAERQPAASARDPAWQIEKRMFLQRLWEELQQLPVNQRVALLLNLKDPSGSGCITLFPATGIATLQQLATTLEIELNSFAALWNELPLEDSRIAELLGLTRQQVINARKSGRERLARRLKGFI